MLTRGQSVAGFKQLWAAMLWHDAKNMPRTSCSNEESMQISLQISLHNRPLAVLPRRLFHFQQLSLTQASNPVAEYMLLASAGLKQAQLTA